MIENLIKLTAAAVLMALIACSVIILILDSIEVVEPAPEGATLYMDADLTRDCPPDIRIGQWPATPRTLNIILSGGGVIIINFDNGSIRHRNYTPDTHAVEFWEVIESAWMGGAE